MKRVGWWNYNQWEEAMKSPDPEVRKQWPANPFQEYDDFFTFQILNKLSYLASCEDFAQAANTKHHAL